MPTTTAPPAEKLPFLEDMAQENKPFEGLDLERMSIVAEKASSDIQADLRNRGMSYVIGREGKLFEVLPTGKEIPYIPNK